MEPPGFVFSTGSYPSDSIKGVIITWIDGQRQQRPSRQMSCPLTVEWKQRPARNQEKMAEGFVSIRTRSDPAGVALQSALPHTHAPTPRGESRWTFQKFWPSPTMQTCTLAHTADATTAAIRNEIWSTPKKLRRVESLLGSRSSLIGGGRFNFLAPSIRPTKKMAAAGQNKKKAQHPNLECAFRAPEKDASHAAHAVGSVHLGGHVLTASLWTNQLAWCFVPGHQQMALVGAAIEPMSPVARPGTDWPATVRRLPTCKTAANRIPTAPWRLSLSSNYANHLAAQIHSLSMAMQSFRQMNVAPPE